MPWNWNSLSVVVTMFSISELACASSSGSVLISMPWFGINSAACFRSASAARAGMQFFRTGLVYVVADGGSTCVAVSLFVRHVLRKCR
jgi:hypothetical protein